MEERFPDEFITWHHKTYPGIKVDEIFGMDSKSGRVWMELARQIYCEQSENYRVIEHFDNGAPYLENYPGRISITHTSHLFAVATLPKTPEINLNGFNLRTAMGIDAELLDRKQVIKVRSKFLSEEEILLVKEDDLLENIIAWTSKEALYKIAFITGLDFKNDIQLKKLPIIQNDPLIGSDHILGEAIIRFPSITESEKPKNLPFFLYSYESYGCCITIAYSPKCAKFGK